MLLMKMFTVMMVNAGWRIRMEYTWSVIMLWVIEIFATPAALLYIGAKIVKALKED